MALYHKDIFLPKRIRSQVPRGIIRLQYSQHARNAAMDDRYGIIQMSDRLDMSTLDIVEVEYYTGKGAVKVVVREVGQEKNRVWALCPIELGWLVKTVWINLADDKHKTLNPLPYEKAVK